MIRLFKNITVVLTAVSLISCGGSGTTETPIDSTEVKSSIDTSKSLVFYNIPSPLETFTILKMSGSAFDKSVLNPTDKM